MESVLPVEFVIATSNDMAPVARLAYANGISRKAAFSAIGRNSMILAMHKAVLGFAMFRVTPDEYELEAVVVAGPVRRCGIATMLIEQVLELATQDGVVAVRASSDYQLALPLLSKNGFTATPYGSLLKKVSAHV